MSAPLHLTTEIQDIDSNSVALIYLDGDLDAHTFPELQDTLYDFLKKGTVRVVLECSKLNYISSAGIGVLNQMSRDFRSKDGDVRLADLSEKIAAMFELLGFSQLLMVFPESASATDSFAE